MTQDGGTPPMEPESEEPIYVNMQPKVRAALGRSVPQPDVQELRDEIIRKAAGYRVSDVPMDWDWDDALAADLDRLIAALGGRSVPAEPTPEYTLNDLLALHNVGTVGELNAYIGKLEQRDMERLDG